ncbi:MAG: M23 family metallopeptidase [Cyanobacteriota bacterium]|nr:M23 family metallopeptidase [Cyanobacteriota bacterium]
MFFNRRIFTALLCMPVVLPLTAAVATDLRDSTSADDLFAALKGIERESAPTAAGSTNFGPTTPPATEAVRSSTSPGVVRFGDTLQGIAERYNLSIEQLMRLNPELRQAPLIVGRRLNVPSNGAAPRVHNLLSLRPAASGGVSWPDTPDYAPSPTQPAGNGRWLWPARGVFTSGYGWRWGRMHKGIDIANSVGTPIVAAQSGRITYAGWNDGGYGYLVEITHEDGSRSIYAHHSRILVQVGEEVSQGQQIGLMGSTGRSTGPHLHFEIHAPGLGAINPMEVLRPAA